MKKPKAELLAPAGSYESMAAAILAGADAVYIGGSRFGARAYADNPDEDKLLEAIDYAHLNGCKLYLTVNTLVKEGELEELYEYINPYYLHGLDAVIVQDFGVFSYIRTHFPDLPVHASTQMTITGVHGARILKELGAERIVTARELSLNEISEIRREVDIEIESFVHGALCYCYSGQCLFSSLIGGRSGNRGRCAQPCRLPYEVKNTVQTTGGNEKYVLSLKDLCTLDLIPDMIEAGVYSMKIEGRMKSPRYTAGVVSIYRKYLDAYLEKGRSGYVVDPKDKRLLLDLFDRGGFTKGYYKQHNGRDMVALKEKPAFREGNQKLFDYLDQTYINQRKKLYIKGQVKLEEGEASSLDLSYGSISVHVLGQVPQRAVNQPITEEKLLKQIKKTGNSPFAFDRLTSSISGHVFMPIQALNELRRDGLCALEEEILKPYRRKQQESLPYGTASQVQGEDLEAGLAQSKDSQMKKPKVLAKMRLHVSLADSRGLLAVLGQKEVDQVYIDSEGFESGIWIDTVAKCHKADKQCLLVMPHIFRTEARDYFIKNLKLWKEADFDGVVIRSVEEVDFLREADIHTFMVFDYSMYTFNHLAKDMMYQMGAGRLTLPVELNSRELETLGCMGGELIVYGHLPMMVSAQCLKKTMDGCTKKTELLYLKDRMGKELPVKNHCRFCYNTFYNPSPLSLLGQAKLVKHLNPECIRLQFTIENETQIRDIVSAYGDTFINGKEPALCLKDFTNGHLKRGVE